MNRLIVIGNGFDLAHKMKTSYADFITDYLRQAFIAKNETLSYQDEILQLPKNGYKLTEDISNYDLDWFLKCIPNRISKPAVRVITGSYLVELNGPFKITPQSDFTYNLLKNCCELKWVDIENEYYSTLIGILDEDNSEKKKKELILLNRQFSFLREKLNCYIILQKPKGINREYNKIFNEEINVTDVVSSNLIANEHPKSSLIINFNYTDTLHQYGKLDLRHARVDNIPINYIHGQAKDEGNPIIFGFGDEMDTYYDRLENEKSNEAFRFVKSFWYLKTSNYHDIVRFTDSDEFQVFVIGHSCGLSDRTMLNMIFEHDNCKSIKIFYHCTDTDDNFRTLTEEISRHFRDKGEMRKKIVPFDKSSPMPQL